MRSDNRGAVASRDVNLPLPYGTEWDLCDHTPSLGSCACVDDGWRLAVSAEVPAPSLGPLWTSRMSGTTVAPLSIQQAANFFNSLTGEMEDRGFFQEWCGFVCVDAGFVAGRLGPDPVERIELETGRADLWPISQHWETWDEGAFLDAVELAGRLVSAGIEDSPSSHYHSWDECGWHFGDFDQAKGYSIFRERTNVVLRRVSGGLELNLHGHVVRVVAEHGELLTVNVTANPLSEEGQIALAVQKFREPDLSTRREAVQILIDVLEPYRDDVRELLGKSDDAALFETANKFWLRHNKPGERKDYEHEVWWEWLFHVFLASIRLVQSLKGRAEGLAGPVAELVRELTGTPPTTFYGGQLAKRLSDLELRSVPPAAQYRLGVAVGRRAARGTVVVQRDGVIACAQSGDINLWPLQYRLGLIDGLFLSDDGQLHVAGLAKYGVHASNAPGVDIRSVRELLARIEAAPLALELTQNRAVRNSSGADLLNAVSACPSLEARAAWTQIAKRLSGPA